MFAAARNSLARAVLRYNRQKQVYRLVVAFNVREIDERTGKYKFPQQSKCDFVSGDFVYDTLEKDLKRIMQEARSRLRTDNIELVE